jgi:hypothetical protein
MVKKTPQLIGRSANVKGMAYMLCCAMFLPFIVSLIG